MDRFARGTLTDVLIPFTPPRVAQRPELPAPEPEPDPAHAPGPTLGTPADARPPTRVCDLASSCPHCGTMMQPEHAHYRCLTCGYRDSCCF